MIRTPRTAAVVGGGIGGLATALFLRRSGWSVEVFERADRLPAAERRRADRLRRGARRAPPRAVRPSSRVRRPR
ncbi:FAD-dependent oxidoreductase [Streptomyces platensis]|uniref:FAD-dependent oxidoreductase n=1 Tax=Streptomyces platensis TaxID=58346 RepID=UPI003F61C20F